MPQSKVLVDTNSYLRLARSIHPLLFQTFGKDEYCLYVLPELDEEFSKSQRLKNTFSWTEEKEYRQNRQHFPVVSKKQKKEIETAFDYIWDHIISVEKGPSPVDATYDLTSKCTNSL